MKKFKNPQWENIYEKSKEDYKYYNIFEPHESIAMVSKFFKKRKVLDVLDIGCGAGRNLLYLSKQGFALQGIDYSKKGINLIKSQLKKHNLKAELKVASFYDKLSFKDNQFDAAISVQSLQHGKETQITKAIKEIERVLKPKGLIFITLSARMSKGNVRLCLVKTAKKIAQNTYIPTMGSERGLTHFIYNKQLIKKHFSRFKIIKLWKDEKDYYCFIAQKKV